MITRIQKWGNSLALRIPKSMAVEAGMDRDTTVEIILEEGMMIVKPVNPLNYTLDSLLAQVTNENVHTEVDTGPAVGKENW